jgi:hypothetical protein
MTQPLAKLGVATVAVALPSCGETGVTQLLYVTSVMPDAGQSQADLVGSEPAPWLQPGEDGTVGVDPGMIREVLPPGLRREHDGASAHSSHASIPHAVHSGTPPDRLAAEARHVLRLHGGSRHPARGAASTRQSGYATRRVRRRASPVPCASRRVRRKHRCHDRSQLSKPPGSESVIRLAGEVFVSGGTGDHRAVLASTPSRTASIAKRNRSSPSPATICAAWAAIRGNRSGGKPAKVV